jgi:hypothetical protein
MVITSVALYEQMFDKASGNFLRRVGGDDYLASEPVNERLRPLKEISAG